MPTSDVLLMSHGTALLKFNSRIPPRSHMILPAASETLDFQCHGHNLLKINARVLMFGTITFPPPRLSKYTLRLPHSRRTPRCASNMLLMSHDLFQSHMWSPQIGLAFPGLQDDMVHSYPTSFVVTGRGIEQFFALTLEVQHEWILSSMWLPIQFTPGLSNMPTCLLSDGSLRFSTSDQNLLSLNQVRKHHLVTQDFKSFGRSCASHMISIGNCRYRRQ